MFLNVYSIQFLAAKLLSYGLLGSCYNLVLSLHGNVWRTKVLMRGVRLGFPLRVGDQIGTRKCAQFQSKSSSFYISHDNLFVDDNH